MNVIYIFITFIIKCNNKVCFTRNIYMETIYFDKELN